MSVLTAPREFFFTRTLSPDTATQRFKALAKVLHPDAPTGDTRLMKLLNSEYDAYQAGTLQPPDIFSDPQIKPRTKKTDIREEDLYTRWSGDNWPIQQAAANIITNIPMYLRNNIIFTTSVERRRVEATGDNTYTYKDDLKGLGFRWDKQAKVWFYEVRV